MAKGKAKAKAKTVTAYDRVKLARDAKRPHIFDFIKGQLLIVTVYGFLDKS